MKLLSVSEVAEQLKVRRQRVHSLAQFYKVPFTRIGNICAMTEASVRKLIALQNANPVARSRSKKIRDRARKATAQ